MSAPDIGKTIQTAAGALKTGISYKIYIVLGICIGIALYLAWLLKFEPIHGLVDGFMITMSNVAGELAAQAVVLFNGALAYFTANPVAGMIGLVTAFGTVYGLASTIRADRAKAETERLANEQIQETQRKLVETSQAHVLATQEISGLKEKLAGYENDTGFTEAQKLISDQVAQLRTKTDEVNTLEKVIENLKLKEKTVYA